MAFKISMIHDVPVWDSLPVAKITDYPLEPRDYKPFAQARLCVSPQSVWVRLWAFEAIPTETSTLMARLNFYPECCEDYMSLSVSYGGNIVCEAISAQEAQPMAQLGLLPRVKRFTSEDLQGIYWGVVFEVPRAVLAKLYGEDAPALAPGKRVTGNLYKLDEGECGEHYGSFYPVDFTQKDALGAKYFGEFELVAY